MIIYSFLSLRHIDFQIIFRCAGSLEIFEIRRRYIFVEDNSVLAEVLKGVVFSVA